jgi:hypothetical protein
LNENASNEGESGAGGSAMKGAQSFANLTPIKKAGISLYYERRLGWKKISQLTRKLKAAAGLAACLPGLQI